MRQEWKCLTSQELPSAPTNLMLPMARKTRHSLSYYIFIVLSFVIVLIDKFICKSDIMNLVDTYVCMAS